MFFDTTSGSQKEDPLSESTNYQPNIPMSTESKSAYIMSQAADENSFTPISEDLLFGFLRRFPHGKLWTFDVDGSLSSSEEDPASPLGVTKYERIEENRMEKRQMEAKLLQHHFPRCRQLLFTGFWDAAASRWFLGGFAWTTASRQIFSVYVGDLNSLLI